MVYDGQNKVEQALLVKDKNARYQKVVDNKVVKDIKGADKIKQYLKKKDTVPKVKSYLYKEKTHSTSSKEKALAKGKK